MMNKKHAFSLAEILVTLMIIGVIAGMTLPSLRHNANNKAIATNLKKVYSELSQASQLALTQEMVSKMCRTSFVKDDATFEREFIMKNFNVITKCENGTPDKCFGSGATINAGTSSYLLANGIALSFPSVTSTFRSCNGGGAMMIYVDVNGPKPPNKAGSDKFIIAMQNNDGKVSMNSTYAAMSEANLKTACESGSDYSMASACAAKIQKDGWEIKY